MKVLSSVVTYSLNYLDYPHLSACAVTYWATKEFFPSKKMWFIFCNFLSDSYTHWFDGMAMMHRFHISEGNVTYCSRFLRSDSYKSNSEKNRIVVSEFGTLATPDPCKNIFARFFSRFQMPSMCVFFMYYCMFPCVMCSIMWSLHSFARLLQAKSNSLRRRHFFFFRFHTLDWIFYCALNFQHNVGWC